MFQRLSNLLFGEVEVVSADLNGPKPCVTEADEEGWLLVNLPGKDCTMLGEGGAGAPAIAQSLPHSEFQRAESECDAFNPSRTHGPAPSRCRSRRTRVGRALAARPPSPSPSSAPCLGSPSPHVSEAVNALSGPARCMRGSAPVSPGSRGCMDESWFITPPPCFTAEGAPAQASPMEDLLIEHPSMSVYVASGNLSVVEQSAASLAGSVSTMSESALPPVARSSKPTRMARGAAHQALAKVTQASRVQRAKARVERRPLGRHRMQRQNHVCQQIPRHSAHTRNAFLHQPCQRGLCH
ncbi:tumor protein p53-inducible nuclear protein 2 isoform X1 [Electrophorus electricus]|uniref:Tumor protein p53 inducible nuclear protein 2 n=1 Tax=Electrophorus electricus TaxID=8005 RepID=A0AAY5EAS5_ELEEL|nr:tumor protein p53-inducible nuclear protein 2 isoform X1 [Electrophorus electricus]